MSDGPETPPGTGTRNGSERRGQLFRSIFRHGHQDTAPNRLQAITSNLWLHLHPARVPRSTLRFSFTLCAGGIAFLLFLVTVVTGLVLLLHYRPTPIHAHPDLVALGQEVPFGAFLRSLHRYAGDGMVIALLVHTVRVLLTGSYKPPREFNWVLGADGPGAVVGVGRDLRSALLGGASGGPATLTRFYALHCVILPLVGAFAMALHFWRVRKDGISEPL